MHDPVISIHNVSKVYKLYQHSTDRLKEALHPRGRLYHQDFYAIRNINLSVSKGEVLGIVGRNGCGKSTLLKLISGVLQPNDGTVKVRGKVMALLELGAGFNPEFTGRQNIRFYATILGIEAAKIAELTPGIIAFADIGEFIDQPLKTYSSGMKARLGFAVASQIEMDILILDEVLAVGDEMFVKKCYDVIRGFIRQGKTILLVSHSAQSIADFCTRAVVVEKGGVRFDGSPADAIKEYRKILYASVPATTVRNRDIPTNKECFDPKLQCTPIVDVDTGELELREIAVAVNGKRVNLLRFDERVQISITLRQKASLNWRQLHTGMTIVTQTGFRLAAIKFSEIRVESNHVKLTAFFSCSLNIGLYTVVFSVVDKVDSNYRIFINDLYVFKVLRDDHDTFYRWAQLEIK